MRANRKILAIFAAITLMLAVSACTSRSQRNNQDKALDDAAAAINAKAGKLVSYQHTGGGLDGPRTLGVVTLRAGSAVTVAEAQIKDAEVAGYKNRSPLPCGGRTGGCGFRRPTTLPTLSIETFAENTTTRTGMQIPPGMTGMIVSLVAQPAQDWSQPGRFPTSRADPRPLAVGASKQSSASRRPG